MWSRSGSSGGTRGPRRGGRAGPTECDRCGARDRRGRSLLLNAHLDTVGLLEPDGGLAARAEGGRLYGRGSYDMKGSLAAIASAGAECARLGLRGDVIVAAVVDEEAAEHWDRGSARTWRADAAIVAEPTEERLCTAHKGFVAFELEQLGRAAHGSRPDLGIDAIAKMGPVLVELESLAKSQLQIRATRSSAQDRYTHP